MKKTLIALCIASVTMLACNKDDDPTPPNIAGYWVGKVGGDINPTDPFAILFRSNGTLRAYVGSADTALATKGDGTFTVTLNGKVNTNYKFSVNDEVSTEGTLSINNTRMDGTWGTGKNVTGGGAFFLDKK